MNNMKKYIAPDIECVEMEPLQICAGSTPDSGNVGVDNDYAESGGAESKDNIVVDAWE